MNQPKVFNDCIKSLQAEVERLNRRINFYLTATTAKERQQIASDNVQALLSASEPEAVLLLKHLVEHFVRDELAKKPHRRPPSKAARKKIASQPTAGKQSDFDCQFSQADSPD